MMVKYRLSLKGSLSLMSLSEMASGKQTRSLAMLFDIAKATPASLRSFGFLPDQ